MKTLLFILFLSTSCFAAEYRITALVAGEKRVWTSPTCGNKEGSWLAFTDSTGVKVWVRYDLVDLIEQLPEKKPESTAVPDDLKTGPIQKEDEELIQAAARTTERIKQISGDRSYAPKTP